MKRARRPFLLAMNFLSQLCFAEVGSEPNPPLWPDHVKIVQPGDPGAQAMIDAIYVENGGHVPDAHGQWSKDRYAILFEPGVHKLNVNVGYYTSIIGLGKTPQDTQIAMVACENGGSEYQMGALCNFWRSAENFYTKPSRNWNNKTCMLWAVSQACPLRRVYVDGDLSLFQMDSNCVAGYSSGGFMADCTVTGAIRSGSQQQWLSRNTSMGTWNGGNWNMVFVGCTNAPVSHCGRVGGGLPYTTIAETLVIAEKPYIILDEGRYYLMIPPLENNKAGPDLNWSQGTRVDFNNVYVATELDDASIINAKINDGLHVILTPGNYHLSDSIQIENSNACLIGIGFPTLIAENGKPCIQVENVDGVRIAGVLLQAGAQSTPALLVWGEEGYAGDSSNPGFLYDCFARVGGTNDPKMQPMTADIMVQINSGNVICDNLWFWRADHDITGLVMNSDNPCFTGFQVNGDHVTAYGLAVEHTLQNLTEWNGENGNVYFYQAEFPYDVTQENYGALGYAAYVVGSNVASHSAWGVGAYCYFRDHPVTVNSAFKTPSTEGIQFTNALSVFLSGNGQITSVIDGKGDPVTNPAQTLYFCSFPLPECGQWINLQHERW